MTIIVSSRCRDPKLRPSQRPLLGAQRQRLYRMSGAVGTVKPRRRFSSRLPSHQQTPKTNARPTNCTGISGWNMSHHRDF
jgi:hypothetical protein